MKLEAIAHDIGKFGLISASLIVVVLIIRFIIERIADNSFETNHIGELLRFIIIGITIVLAAIPHGLPLTISLT